MNESGADDQGTEGESGCERFHDGSVVDRRASPAVGPVPVPERITLVSAAGALSGVVAAITRRGVCGRDESRGGDQRGESESSNVRLHVTSPWWRTVV